MKVASLPNTPVQISRAQMQKASSSELVESGVFERYSGDTAGEMLGDLMSQKKLAEQAASREQLTQLGLFGISAATLTAGVVGLALGTVLGPIGIAGGLAAGALFGRQVATDDTTTRLHQVADDHVELYNAAQRASGGQEARWETRPDPAGLGDDSGAYFIAHQGSLNF
ncbi:MAG: hypothetical protein J0I12_28180 [Candidatus Eremiobacteraeota bacterium]|nr:hypothetical protein [Candidatus Eremiobacteraeota bacterium]